MAGIPNRGLQQPDVGTTNMEVTLKAAEHGLNVPGELTLLTEPSSP